MATYQVKDIIGKHLVAKKIISAHKGSPEGSNVFFIKPKQDVGTVFSYVLRDGRGVWWEFIDAQQNVYFVKHDSSAFDVEELENQGVVDDAEKHKADLEAKKKEEMGAFAYYAQKWGKTILIVSAVTTVAVAAVKYNKRGATS